MSGTVEIFFTNSLQPRKSFNTDEIAQIELLDFDIVKMKVTGGELIDSALIIATLLISEKELCDKASR